MAAQKHTKKVIGRDFFAILNVYYSKTHLIKAFNSLDSARTNGQLSQNSKTRGFRELFLPENDFKTCSTENLLKRHPDIGGLQTNQKHEIQTLFFFHLHFWKS